MAIGNERPARIKLEAPSGQLEEDLRRAQEKLRKFEGRNKKKKKKDNGAKLMSAARIGAGALEQAGATLFDTFAGGVGDAVDVERALTRFQIAGNVGAQSMLEFRAELSKVGIATGVTRSELLAGSAAYLALTGDADGARTSVALFAKVANASGATMTDVANTAAALRENLKINPADFEKGFSALIVQGKAGAIELKDLSQELAGVAPQFSAFKKGAGLEGLATMGAALQAGRKGFSSASEAATGFRALMVALNRNATKFSGVKIFDTNAKTGKKSLRSFRQIIDDIAKSRLAKDPTLLTKAFGSDEAKRFYDQLVLNRKLMDDLEKQSADGGAVATDALAYQQSAAGQLEQSMEKLKIAIASAFTPEVIAKFASALSNLADIASRFAEAANAIFEYSEVRDMKNRNERQLAELGEYEGDDHELGLINRYAKARIARDEKVQAPILRAARAEKLVSSVGAGLLAPPSLMSGSSIAAPTDTVSRLPQAPTATEILPSLSPTGFGQSVAPINISLTIDGEAIATSQKNARSKRRNVGGR